MDKSDGSLLSDAANATKQTVYFPTDINRNAIPDCLPLLTIAARAAQNTERKELFSRLGVKYAHPQLVLDEIEYFNHRLFSGLIVRDSVCNLKYIYYTLTQTANVRLPCFLLLDHNEIAITTACTPCCFPPRKPDDLYFETDGEYGSKAIARMVETGPSSGISIRLLHQAYLQPISDGTGNMSDSWMKWLEEVVLVRRVPRMRHIDEPDRLSGLFEAIVNYHQDILLEVLKTYWDTYEKEMTPSIVSAIKQAVVPISNGHMRLDRCYLPTPELHMICRRVLRSTLDFPFLMIPQNSAQIKKSFGFLSLFGVSGDATKTFFIDVANRLRDTIPLDDAKSEFFELYNCLSERPLGDIRCVCMSTSSRGSFQC